MRSFLRLASWISWMGAIVAAVIVTAMTAHILLEILMRGLFSKSTFVMQEFVGYGVASAIFLALGYTLDSGNHIRVILLPARLGPRAKVALELLCIGIALFGTLFLWFFFCRSLVRNWSRGAVSDSLAQVPLWIPESAIVLGLTILFLQLLANALRVCRPS